MCGVCYSAFLFYVPFFVFPCIPRRTDLPRYLVYSKGRLVEDTFDLLGFDWNNRTTFYLGCSFTFEEALQEAGIEVRNVKEGKNVSMYHTSLRLHPIGSFDCEMFVSMRPVSRDLLSKAFAVTAGFPDAHGPPIHIGDPARIGIRDISQPSRGGDTSNFNSEDVPVFWACGVTTTLAVASASESILC